LCSPRIVVAEYNALFGPAAASVPTNPSFERSRAHYSNLTGRSLPALVHLGGAKGYLLVGCNSAGNNAFFRSEGCAGTASRARVARCVSSSEIFVNPNADGSLSYLDAAKAIAEIGHLPLINVTNGSQIVVGGLHRLLTLEACAKCKDAAIGAQCRSNTSSSSLQVKFVRPILLPFERRFIAQRWGFGQQEVLTNRTSACIGTTFSSPRFETRSMSSNVWPNTRRGSVREDFLLTEPPSLRDKSSLRKATVSRTNLTASCLSWYWIDIEHLLLRPLRLSTTLPKLEAVKPANHNLRAVSYVYQRQVSDFGDGLRRVQIR